MPENDSKAQMDALLSRMWNQESVAAPAVKVISVEESCVYMTPERKQRLEQEAREMRERLFPLGQ